MKYKIFIPKSIYNEPQILEVTGYPVDFNLPYNLFAAKRDPKGLWAIYEEKSGGRLGPFEKTRGGATLEAERWLECVHPETLKLAIEIGVKNREEFENLDK